MVKLCMVSSEIFHETSHTLSIMMEWAAQISIFIIVNEVTFKYPECRSLLQTQQENYACQKRVTCSACRNSIKVIDSVHLISCLRVQKLLAPKAMNRVHAGRKKGYTMIDSITHWGLNKMADMQHFQMYFRERKVWYFSIFRKGCS